MTIENLDKDLVSTMPFMQTIASYLQEHQIDLTLLKKSLNSSKDISEADVPWSNLFSDVKSELQSERERQVCASNQLISLVHAHA